MEKITLEKKGNILIITPYPEATVDEAVSYIKENVIHWEDYYLIWDLRDKKFEICSPQHITALLYQAKNVSPIRSGKRTAFLVSDSLGYGFTRMYIGQLETSLHDNVNIFYNLEEAEEWLLND